MKKFSKKQQILSLTAAVAIEAVALGPAASPVLLGRRMELALAPVFVGLHLFLLVLALTQRVRKCKVGSS